MMNQYGWKIPQNCSMPCTCHSPSPCRAGVLQPTLWYYIYTQRACPITAAIVEIASALVPKRQGGKMKTKKLVE